MIVRLAHICIEVEDVEAVRKTLIDKGRVALQDYELPGPNRKGW